MGHPADFLAVLGHVGIAGEDVVELRARVDTEFREDFMQVVSDGAGA
jgi:hypothetical protein